MSKFQFVEVGNWYSEYKCTNCGEHIVVNDDQDCLDLDKLHQCSSVGKTPRAEEQ